ncbi:ribonuclease J [Arthrobacter sp. zg-Y40]|uniref:ribonuclease J n=1 Tax=unclassified Arthrobacter TaxID=235627 RepID=UPI001D1570CB|nr:MULTISPECIES: ribonuclease J [unclassified Arthrobacter]MCC3274611.1 ribonuclease J [Arthrobacter sp. zg-Y20]MCC3279414.1 ribonuclease J [Arthrobacter sp. zg-Y40]MDK1314768.1 ribonuclease J [Arthrobacter sp. zg.Y20]MDK1327634.1 ribonuclease J [Arthrobacter sp. zg-Y1143]WIB07817.1 ribonuclease J [Arthrobacter sp. zg-Y20]
MRVMNLGGLGEIGRNMTVFEFDGKLLIVDCGVLFPEEEHPGVNLILPDFTAIRDRLQDVVAVVLTHGHEDHIGGVPYLLRERSDIPIVGSKLTLAFIEAKLKEHRIKPKLIQVKEGDRRTIGGFDLEFLAVNHSIPDGLAIAIRTAAGLALHTGDFKMDQFPLDRRITDLTGFARLGVEGVDLFLTDSTNAEVPGFMASEKELAPAIDTVFRTAPRRIIVSSFASHIHRIQQVIDAASRYNRKVAFVGRSMIRNMTIAEELGYLNIPKGILVDFKSLQRTDDHKVVLICTGSQGEPMAALSRMANNDHQIRIHEGDTVLMASSLIPGNENAIYGIINNLTKIGANVVHKGNAKVHVSGHASAGELAYCYNIVKPRNVMPVHGEWRHLKANGAIAEATGMDPRDVVLAENGMTVDLRRGRATISGKHQVDLVFVDGDSVGHTTEETLKERMQLAEEGAVTVLALVDADTGTIAEPAEFFTKGFTIKSEDLSKGEEAVEKALANAASGNRRGPKGEDLEDVIERAVANWMRRFYNRTPAITAIVVDA